MERKWHSGWGAGLTPLLTGARWTSTDVPSDAGDVDVIEELPPVRAALVQAEKPEAEQRNLLAADGLNGSEKKLYELMNAEQPVHIDDIVEHRGTLRLELFRCSGYAIYARDERDCLPVAGKAVLQGVLIERDSGPDSLDGRNVI